MSELNFNIPFQPFRSQSKKFINLTGQIFSKLQVYSVYAQDRRGETIWLCKCSCDKWAIIRGQALRCTSRPTRSCGCLRSDNRASVLHGETGQQVTTEYRSYSQARNRCNNPHNQSFHNYGGRGIRFCFDSFESFLTEMGRKPTPQHSLERIDNNGNYTTGNLRWATKKEQNHNRRNNVCYTFQGETKIAIEWARSLHLGNSFAIRQRLNRGWCEKCTFTLLKPFICTHKLLRKLL